MGLSIQLTLTKPSGRDWYTSLDSICGIVHVCSKRPVAVSSICVYLEGSPPVGDDPLVRCLLTRPQDN